ncbi:MAG: DNA-directed RNA polymerase subunit beta', partial [Gammaproteobacteria bacterium]|nr:DNA-directed RNA polymerase subunit beta' [Gammaproteobacteria bacterium]
QKSLVVIDYKEDLHPQVIVVNAKGEAIANYPIPSGAHIVVEEGDAIVAGSLIAKTPRQAAKTRDITGGLPRVADLFEARKPKDAAILAEISGLVSFGKETKGKNRLVITPTDGSDTYEELIPKWRVLNVFEGESVEKGEIIADGPSNPHDILRILGVEALANYIATEVQEVYRLQGVGINDKHVEVIVRQMLRKVDVTSSGDTNLIKGDQVEYTRFMEANEKLDGEDKIHAHAQRVLLGITKASLATESFISAASFQETTRVLTEGAVTGKKDHLRGLKENVVVGRLIPAGTGLAYHSERKRKRQEQMLAEGTATVSAEEVQAALTEALRAEMTGG